MRYTLIAVLLSTTAIASAQTAAAQGQVFDLGTITISAGDPDSTVSPTGVAISNEQIYIRNATSLDAALANLPGVNATMDSNGRRNERDIFVRGFGRWQVPLTIDGVRIYLPADNRLDFNRFPTADLSEIQIEKGYASVLNGPGGMGGWINLVTRKPVKPLEGEFIAGFNVDNRGSFNGWQSYGRIGTLQERFYLQASFTSNDQDFWTLSRKYRPTPTSLEDGNRRINSDSGDWRLNLKAGFTPNETDEYVFNYVRQEGFKGGPLHVRTNPPVPPNGFWRWPQWDVQNISFLSNTRIGEVSYVKTKFYYNTFDNLLSAFDNINYTTQSNAGRFNSYYNDNAYGASVEGGTQIIPRNLLKVAAHIRFDTHKEYNDNQPTNPGARNIEPVQVQQERTWSIAAENTFNVNSNVDWIVGVSYDENKLTRVEEYNSIVGLFSYPTGGSDAFNWQSMLVWRYTPAGQLHASISSRSRFPTLFERFSTRFGSALPNPDLGPEKAINYELGWKYRFNPETRVEAAVFYSDVKDFIQSVQLPTPPNPANTTQFQNVGDGHFYGFEISGQTRLNSQLTLGGNYTFIRREITDVVNTAFRPTGVPTHKAYVYVNWQVLPQLEIIPSLEMASARWTDVVQQPAGPVGIYNLTGSYTMANLTARYRITQNLDITAGVRNLLDKHYELADGLPEPGRTFFAKARATF